MLLQCLIPLLTENIFCCWQAFEPKASPMKVRLGRSAFQLPELKSL